MNNTKQEQTDAASFIVESFGSDIYSVRHPLWQQGLHPGGAIMQSWVILGKTMGMVLDGPVPEVPGFARFLTDCFYLPFRMYNTHGHIDHTGLNGQFSEIWLDQADWPLLAGGGMKPAVDASGIQNLSYQVHPIPEGTVIDLGGRSLTAIHLPGHTPGSVMFFDHLTGILFSGDAVARRLLYGLSGWTPLSEYLKGLEKLKQVPIRGIASMHDTFLLPPDLSQKIERYIRQDLIHATNLWEMPGSGEKFIHLVEADGVETSPDFFDMVVPLARMDEVRADIAE